MKTIIKIQETENRKYKKVMVKVSVLLLGLVLNSFTVGSQNSFETGKLTNGMDVRLEQPFQDATILASAHRSVMVHTSPTAVKISSFKIEPIAEKNLEIEGWMTDLSNFGQMANYADEKEEPLEVEEWMIDELDFGNEGEGRPKDGEGKPETRAWGNI